VVAVLVDDAVLVPVSVDAPVVDEALVSAVVDVLVVVVVEPQAAMAASAPAAAKLRIKRMLSSSRKWDGGGFVDQPVSRLGAI